MEIQMSPTDFKKNVSNASLRELRPGVEHARLSQFVGIWRIEGKNGEASLSPFSRVTGEESYEWMAGGFFLLCRWDRYFDDRNHEGLGVFGYDHVNNKYFANFFDNLGFTRRYDVEISDRKMKIHGKSERAIITIAGDHQHMLIHWEFSKDGMHWKSLCDLEGNAIHAGSQ